MKTQNSSLTQMTLPMSISMHSSSPKTRRTTGREVVVFRRNSPPKIIPGGRTNHSESPLKAMILDVNARSISPRALQELSLELYAVAILSWEEHEDLAFQVDLHPDFPHTIGALTGEAPLPDQPRDFVKEWEQRLAFENRYAPKGAKHKRALHILSVLRRINSLENS